MSFNTKTKKSDENAEQEILERTSPPGQIVYRAVHDEGEHELGRDSGALAWSGLAAGLSMGFSFLAQAFLLVHLPDESWRPLVLNLGYTVGFLIVILGRQQLFTENTLTVVLPYLAKPKKKVLFNVGRLWGVVLTANLIGGFVFAALIGRTPIFDPEVRAACLEIGHNVMVRDWGITFFRAIFAGWLLALMVWLLPFAESARIWIIIIISYLVGLGKFAHIVVGAMEAFYVVVVGDISFGECLTRFLIPTFIGNIIGGVTMVAILAHAQFMASGRGEGKKK